MKITHTVVGVIIVAMVVVAPRLHAQDNQYVVSGTLWGDQGCSIGIAVPGGQGLCLQFADLGSAPIIIGMNSSLQQLQTTVANTSKEIVKKVDDIANDKS
jgi:hypothetical protein